MAGPSKSAWIWTLESNPVVERLGREARGVIFATGLLREQTKMESPDCTLPRNSLRLFFKTAMFTVWTMALNMAIKMAKSRGL
jgi:hypothetical protein